MDGEKRTQPSREQLIQAQLYTIQCGIPWRIPKEIRDKILQKDKKESEQDKDNSKESGNTPP